LRSCHSLCLRGFQSSDLSFLLCYILFQASHLIDEVLPLADELLLLLIDDLSSAVLGAGPDAQLVVLYVFVGCKGLPSIAR
jgi:hypothetical protein